ncbi:MAG: tetratricopeptide repeat protein, partial [Myxococcales bacterium]|nr:tetratricopeptide repeat protein [Myxococcales bacterium]
MNRNVLRAACLSAALALATGCGTSEPLLTETAEYHAELAYGHWGAGEVPQAIEELENALQINPELAEAHYMLGFIYSGRQMLPQSIQHYRQALLLRPEWDEVKNN